MDDSIKLFDMVALTQDLPERGMRRGQVGAVVEILAPDVYEVEFADSDGQTYAMFACPRGQLMRLHYEPVRAAG